MPSMVAVISKSCRSKESAMSNEIDFMGKKETGYGVLLSAHYYLNRLFGRERVSFWTGLHRGTLVEVEYEKPPAIPEIRQRLVSAGYERL